MQKEGISGPILCDGTDEDHGCFLVKTIVVLKILTSTLKLLLSLKLCVCVFHPFFKKFLHVTDERVEINYPKFLSDSKIH